MAMSCPYLSRSICTTGSPLAVSVLYRSSCISFCSFFVSFSIARIRAINPSNTAGWDATSNCRRCSVSSLTATVFAQAFVSGENLPSQSWLCTVLANTYATRSMPNFSTSSLSNHLFSRYPSKFLFIACSISCLHSIFACSERLYNSSSPFARAYSNELPYSGTFSVIALCIFHLSSI